jgi:hypothetical protein
MASIITATTTSGLTQSADNSGVLQLASGVGNLVTIPTGTGTAVVNGVNSSIVSATAVASTSGTSIDFTSIPNWVRRVTVMFRGVSTNGTSPLQIQIGSGSVTVTGYLSGAWLANTLNAGSTTGFILMGNNAANTAFSGSIFINLITSNQYISSGVLGQTTNPPSVGAAVISGGDVSLGGALDRVRITTVNGTDTFDAGTINILYE